MSRTPRVVFVSKLRSPFQGELADAIRARADFEYRTLYTMPNRAARGSHWLSGTYDEELDTCAPPGLSPGQQARYAKGLLSELRPDVVILGGLTRGPIHSAVRRLVHRMAGRLGFWLEPPNLLRSVPERIVANAMVALGLRGASFVMAIGDRAERHYRRFAPPSAEVFLVPYGQDLSACFSVDRTAEPDRMRFLFSGQLLKRHNIPMIGRVVRRVAHDFPGRVTFTVAGYGPEEKALSGALGQGTEMDSVVRYDRDYETWRERLRPFAESDVLVYPCMHSGWGLVIPEIMASGAIAITTRRVEAARYFITHRVDGVIIQPSEAELYREMRWCVEYPEEVYSMGREARLAARRGQAEAVAERFCRVVERCLASSPTAR